MITRIRENNNNNNTKQEMKVISFFDAELGEDKL